MKALPYERPSAFPKQLQKLKWDTCSDLKNDNSIIWIWKVFCYKILLLQISVLDSSHAHIVWSWRSPARDPSQAIYPRTSPFPLLQKLPAALESHNFSCEDAKGRSLLCCTFPGMWIQRFWPFAPWARNRFGSVASYPQHPACNQPFASLTFLISCV